MGQKFGKIDKLNVIRQYFTQPNPVKILIWLSIKIGHLPSIGWGISINWHGTAKVLSSDNEAGFARLSDKVALSGIKQTSKRKEAK